MILVAILALKSAHLANFGFLSPREFLVSTLRHCDH